MGKLFTTGFGSRERNRNPSKCKRCGSFDMVKKDKNYWKCENCGNVQTTRN